MSEFYLVRHGQASFGAENYDKLSELGQQQTVLLGQYFKEKNTKFDRVLVGDMVRHHETATGICQGLERDVSDFEVLPELNEFDFHSLIRAYLQDFPEQKLERKNDFKAYFRLLKKSIAAWQEDALPGPLPEIWEGFKKRVTQALDFIHQSSNDPDDKQRLLVVSSGGAKAVAMKHILGLQDDKVMPLKMQIRNTGVSHFFCSSEQILLTSFNHVPHLDCQERLNSITYS